MASHYFITGGTGLVGTYLLPRLFRRHPSSAATLLVRAKDGRDASERIRAVARRLVVVEGIADAPARLDGIPGDVAADRCGLTEADTERIVRTATHIVHGAATIRFDHPLDEARAINCGGTARMLHLAAHCASRGRLERFLYIGTSSVSGRRSGRILEDELEAGQTFFNTYEQSKCESERLVRDRFHEVPATIVRPSIIIGDSRTGATTTFNVIYIPLRLLQRGLLTAIPGRPDTPLDLVPVDWVCDAAAAIMDRSDSAGAVYHLTAGPGRAARLGDVVVRAARFFDRHTPAARPRSIEFITDEEFARRRAAVRGREEALMTQLDTLLPYVTVDRLFDSAHADAALAGSGVVFPPFSTYAERILSYCLESNWGKRG